MASIELVVDRHMCSTLMQAYPGFVGALDLYNLFKRKACCLNYFHARNT